MSNNLNDILGNFPKKPVSVVESPLDDYASENSDYYSSEYSSDDYSPDFISPKTSIPPKFINLDDEPENQSIEGNQPAAENQPAEENQQVQAVSLIVEESKLLKVKPFYEKAKIYYELITIPISHIIRSYLCDKYSTIAKKNIRSIGWFRRFFSLFSNMFLPEKYNYLTLKIPNDQQIDFENLIFNHFYHEYITNLFCDCTYIGGSPVQQYSCDYFNMNLITQFIENIKPDENYLGSRPSSCYKENSMKLNIVVGQNTYYGLIHEAYVYQYILNPIKKYIPTVPYLYFAGVGDLPIEETLSTLNLSTIPVTNQNIIVEKPFILFRERVNVNLETFIKNNIGLINSEPIMEELYLQYISFFNIAEILFKMNIYDLNARKLRVRVLTNEVYFPFYERKYNTGWIFGTNSVQVKYFFKTFHILMIDDFSHSSFEVGGKLIQNKMIERTTIARPGQPAPKRAFRADRRGFYEIIVQNTTILQKDLDIVHSKLDNIGDTDRDITDYLSKISQNNKKMVVENNTRVAFCNDIFKDFGCKKVIPKNFRTLGTLKIAEPTKVNIESIPGTNETRFDSLVFNFLRKTNETMDSLMKYSQEAAWVNKKILPQAFVSNYAKLSNCVFNLLDALDISLLMGFDTIISYWYLTFITIGKINNIKEILINEYGKLDRETTFTIYMTKQYNLFMDKLLSILTFYNKTTQETKNKYYNKNIIPYKQAMKELLINLDDDQLDTVDIVIEHSFKNYISPHHRAFQFWEGYKTFHLKENPSEKYKYHGAFKERNGYWRRVDEIITEETPFNPFIVQDIQFNPFEQKIQVKPIDLEDITYVETNYEKLFEEIGKIKNDMNKIMIEFWKFKYMAPSININLGEKNAIENKITSGYASEKLKWVNKMEKWKEDYTKNITNRESNKNGHLWAESLFELTRRLQILEIEKNEIIRKADLYEKENLEYMNLLKSDYDDNYKIDMNKYQQSREIFAMIGLLTLTMYQIKNANLIIPNTPKISVMDSIVKNIEENNYLFDIPTAYFIYRRKILEDTIFQDIENIIIDENVNMPEDIPFADDAMSISQFVLQNKNFCVTHLSYIMEELKISENDKIILEPDFFITINKNFLKGAKGYSVKDNLNVYDYLYKSTLKHFTFDPLTNHAGSNSEQFNGMEYFDFGQRNEKIYRFIFDPLEEKYSSYIYVRYIFIFLLREYIQKITKVTDYTLDDDINYSIKYDHENEYHFNYSKMTKETIKSCYNLDSNFDIVIFMDRTIKALKTLREYTDQTYKYIEDISVSQRNKLSQPYDILLNQNKELEKKINFIHCKLLSMHDKQKKNQQFNLEATYGYLLGDYNSEEFINKMNSQDLLGCNELKEKYAAFCGNIP